MTMSKVLIAVCFFFLSFTMSAAATPNPVEVDKTIESRGSPQCRMDTLLAGYFSNPRPRCWYQPNVVLSGTIPLFEFPNLPEQAQKTWEFVRNRMKLPSSTVPPEIFFNQFTKEAQGEEFNAWQRHWLLGNHTIWQDWVKLKRKGEEIEVTQEWVNENIDTIFPFPKTFLAFHYDNTNVIQMSPKRTMLSSYQNGPDGIKRDYLGAGFYTMGHEMFHYALQEVGILPGRIHHCLFVKQVSAQGTSVIQDLAEFLIKSGYSSEIMRSLGPDGEANFEPCEKLSSDDLVLVDQYVDVLSELSR